MKTFSKRVYLYIYLGSLVVLVIFLSIFSSYKIKKDAPVTYVDSLPGSIMAMTLPPFGIFIEERYIDEGDAKGSILAHERIHWLQYQERGLFGFYNDYINGWLRHGRLYNEMEEDARKRSE
jgi:hypothetical protein